MSATHNVDGMKKLSLLALLGEVRSKSKLIYLFDSVEILDNGYYKGLLIHYVESQHNLDRGEFEDLVGWLLKNRNKYPDQISTGVGRYAWRGTAIDPQTYKSIMNHPTAVEGGMTTIRAPYESANSAQSFTTSKAVADRFASRGLFNNPKLDVGAKPALIRAKMDANFVGGPVIERLNLILGHLSEKEVFHYGKRIPEVTYYIATADVNKLKTYVGA